MISGTHCEMIYMKSAHIAQVVHGVKAEFVAAARQALPIYLAPINGAIKQVGICWKQIQSR